MSNSELETKIDSLSKKLDSKNTKLDILLNNYDSSKIKDTQTSIISDGIKWFSRVFFSLLGVGVFTAIFLIVIKLLVG